MPGIPVNDDSKTLEGFWLEEWLVQPRLGRIVRDQVVVPLRPRVMDVLVALASRAGEVVSKRDLVDSVWSSGFVADNTINHCLKELRKDLGDSATAPRFVQTVPRRGYRLMGRVRPIEAGDAIPGIEVARCILEGQGWSAYLLEGENLIGRGGEARIVVESPRVSRHHARIVISGESAIVEDLGSKNGTFVGERRIEEPASLSDGDLLRVGDVQIVFRSLGIGGPDATLTM